MTSEQWLQLAASDEKRALSALSEGYPSMYDYWMQQAEAARQTAKELAEDEAAQIRK